MAIEWVVSDLDDTHLYTHLHFQFYTEACIQHLCQSGKRAASPSNLPERFKAIDADALLVPDVSVRPDRWVYVLGQLAQEFPFITTPLIQSSLEILNKIYTTAPKLREDSPFALDYYKLLGLRTTVFSHSSQKITEFKLQQTGIDKLIDLIGNVNPLAPKDAATWYYLITRQIGISPQQVIAIGDHKKSDVWAAYEAGVPANQIFWYDGKNGMPFAKKGTLPPDVHCITSHFQLPYFLPQILTDLRPKTAMS